MSNKAKAQEMFDCIFTRPCAEDDILLNDWVNSIMVDVAYHLFHRQEDICYMIDEKNPPMLKDGAIQIMREETYKSFSCIINYIICRILIEYRMENIDLGEEAEWYLHEEFEDEEWEALNQAINHYIWNDYASVLGAEKAKAYFERIGKPEYIMED